MSILIVSCKKMIKNISKSPHEVAKAFAKDFATWVAGKSRINVALSGGSTPKLLFKLWAEEYKTQINWSTIHFFWGDERCVPPDHEESNFRMTQELLLQHIDIPAENIHRIHGEAPPDHEAERYSSIIAQHLDKDENNWPIFDLIILGMGADGHTASIFSHQMELLDRDSICAVATHPQSGQNRITLTGKVLNRAKKVCFLITGKSKFSVLNQIFDKKDDWLKYPTSHIQPEGELVFYLDETAVETTQ